MISIEKQFTYHPPQTEQRKQLHDRCNELCLILAQFIDDNLTDEEFKKLAIASLQNTRMLINQTITYDELNFLEECEKRNVGEIQIPVEKNVPVVALGVRPEDVEKLKNIGKVKKSKIDLKSKIKNHLERTD